MQGATLTLLALLIGLTLSITVNRYDQRKNQEKEELNAFGTEYVRADLIGEASGPKVRALLAQYLELRIANDRTRNTNDSTPLIARPPPEVFQLVVASTPGSGVVECRWLAQHVCERQTRSDIISTRFRKLGLLAEVPAGTQNGDRASRCRSSIRSSRLLSLLILGHQSG
jgi:hypothetical protein